MITDLTNDIRGILDDIDVESSSSVELMELNGNAPLYQADFANDLYFYNGSSYPSLNAYLSAVGYSVARLPRAYRDVDGKNVGILMEGERTNLAWPSGNFSDARWTKANSTVTANIGYSYDGSYAATKLFETTATGYHQLQQSFTISAGARCSGSWIVKAGTSSKGLVWIGSGGAGIMGDFDLSAGVASAYNFGSATEMDVQIIPMADGWFRVSASAKVSTLTTINFALILRDSYQNHGSYTGNAANYMWVGHGQFETAASASSIIPTFSGTVIRLNDKMERTMSAPSAVTKVVKGRTSTIPNDIAADDVYRTFTHMDNNDAVNYSDFELYRYSDGHLYVEVHKGPGGAVSRGKVDLGFISDNTDFTVAYTASSALDLKASLNGATAVTATLTAWPTDLIRDRVGQNAWGTPYRSAHGIISLDTCWFDTATASQLEALST